MAEVTSTIDEVCAAEEADIDRIVLADIDHIAAVHAAISGSDPAFWLTLGAAHRRKIERYGFATFKRHINFQYGQWGISTFRSQFTRRVFASLMRAAKFPWGAFAHVDWHNADDIRWPEWIDVETGESHESEERSRRRLLAYALYCGLLWQYASTGDNLGCLTIQEPALGRPMPIWLRGRLISQDIATASLDLNRMAAHIPLHEIKQVLEIGAGYGRLAYLFHSLFPAAQYSIADISPALAVSQNYLAAVFGEDRVRRFGFTPAPARAINFLLPHQLDQMADGYFDLAINVSSFDEMPPEVSIGYLRTIERVCRGYVFLEGYARASHAGRLGLDELPYNSSWRLLYSRPHGLFPGWVEKVFAI